MDSLAKLATDILSQVDTSKIYLFYIFAFVHFSAEPLRWYFFLEAKNRLTTFLKIFYFSSFLSYALPMKLGIPIRFALIKSKLCHKTSTISSVLILDGGFYYLGWVIATGVAIMISPFVVKNIFNVNKIEHYIFPFFIFMSLLSIVVITISKYYKPNKPTKIGNWIRNFSKSVFQTRSSTIIKVVFIITIDITSHILRHWALLLMFGYNASAQQLFVLTTLSIFAGLISMMPMGIGGYDLTLIFLLCQIPIPIETAVLVPIANRIGTISLSFILAAGSSKSLGMSLIKRNEILKLTKFQCDNTKDN